MSERQAGTRTRTPTRTSNECIPTLYVGCVSVCLSVCVVRAYLSYRKCNSRHRMRARVRVTCTVIIVYTRIASAVPIRCRASRPKIQEYADACAPRQHDRMCVCAQKLRQCTVFFLLRIFFLIRVHRLTRTQTRTYCSDVSVSKLII